MTTTEEHLAELAASIEQAASGQDARQRLARLEVLPGGHSGLTHVATLAQPSGQTRVVVKSAPPGRPPRGRHDVLRQARILRALGDWGGISAPKVVFWSDAPIPLFAMSLVDGFAAEPVMEDPRPDESAVGVAAAWRGAIDLLAALQQATPADLGLQGEPVLEPLDELARWSATMRSAGLDRDEHATRLARRLEVTAPAGGAPCVVHGDFRLGNMLQSDGVIRALVDWEIWALGDGRSDLGWLTLFTDAANFPGFGRPAPGTPTAEAVVARYLEATGTSAAGVDWFRALACFKLAAVSAHNLRRHVEGRYHDPHQERLVESTSALLDHGLTLIA